MKAAGYTGVTASGAGYSGMVPVDAGIVTYDAVVDARHVTASEALTYAVTATEVVFTDAEGETVVADKGRYAYEWDIGPVSAFVTAETATSVMKDSPNVVFPFRVTGSRGERRIELDAEYDLQDARWPGDKGTPVRVVESGPTSFTFETLPGHFRGAGRLIRFVTMARDGRLLLRQEGTSSGGLADCGYDVGAKVAWQYQADNLRAALYGGTRASFPGAWPISW